MKSIFILACLFSAFVCILGASKGLGQKIECFGGYETFQARIYEPKIRELIENLRDQLKNGIPESGIPPLDPFVMTDWRLQIKEEFAKLDWNMTGNIAGLMSWDLTDIKFMLAGFKFSFGILFKTIPGKGAYSIDGSIMDVLPVYGKGEFDVLADNLFVNGSGKIGVKGSGEEQELFLENFNIAMSLEKFTFGVTGLMDDEQLSFLLSQMISDSLPDMIRNFQAQINSVVSEKVTELANKAMDGMTIQDILDMIKPKPAEKLWYNIHCGDY